MAKENGKTAAQPLLSLTDLPTRNFTVKIEIEGQDDPVLIECRALTYKRYQEIGRMVEDPAPPVMAGPRGKIYDYQDPEYQLKRNAANERRSYLRLAEFIQAEIPGDDIHARAEWISENVEMGISMTLVAQMENTIKGGSASIEARAATFHGK